MTYNQEAMKITPESAPKNGAELVAYWQTEGVIGSRSDIENSQEHARKIRRKAETRELERWTEKKKS